MTAPVIPTLPAAPNRNDSPDTFVAKADAHVAALVPWTTAANALGTWTNDIVAPVAGQAATAANAADIATQAAISAVNAPGTNATSSTNMSIGAGSVSFTIQPGKSLVIGAFVTISAVSSPNNWMYGNITAYNSSTGDITINSVLTSGSGAFTNWSVALSGPINKPSPSAVVYSYNTFGGL